MLVDLRGYLTLARSSVVHSGIVDSVTQLLMGVDPVCLTRCADAVQERQVTLTFQNLCGWVPKVFATPGFLPNFKRKNVDKADLRQVGRPAQLCFGAVHFEQRNPFLLWSTLTLAVFADPVQRHRHMQAWVRPRSDGRPHSAD